MGGSFPALADQVKVLALGDEVAELFFHVIFFGYPGTPPFRQSRKYMAVLFKAWCFRMVVENNSLIRPYFLQEGGSGIERGYP